ncbi:DUF4136 domain-containing protein [Thalassotalea crassostreae]|uniref:DUF4136 domain-containing protein n=1 Tax=Thalassotalea crassostreae TaxID=1763536 RepID=UPI000837BBA1|nr:DUF4136 domain-containing protein [Thalassotalea crassostreae]
MKTMKLAILPVLMLLSACTTTLNAETDYSVDYDFTSVKTYNIVGDVSVENPMLSDINRDRINNAIAANLNSKGFATSVEKDADVKIQYFVFTKDRTQVTTIPMSVVANCYRCRYRTIGTASTVDVRQYTEGTLIVDVIDNKTAKTVWRSSLSQRIKNYDNAKERDEAVRLIIEAIFKEFPPQVTAVE